MLRGELIRKHRKTKGWGQEHFAKLCSLSTRTIIRAEQSKNIAFETAGAIAAVLGLAIPDLIDDNTDQAIGNIIESWFAKGTQAHSTHPHLPLHPEFIYRLSGEWRGWNDFLGIDTDDQEFDTHRRIDEVEDRAFLLVSIVLKHQKRRLQRKVESAEIDMAVGMEILTGCPLFFNEIER